MNHLQLDEKRHVEEPLLRQLETMPGLHWRVLRLEMGPTQTADETQRSSLEQVLMYHDLEAALRRINPWMNDAHIAEAIKDLSTFEGDGLYTNNQRIQQYLTHGTKVQVQTPDGLRYQDVFFVDYDQPERNSFVAVSQFKIRIIGTDRHFYPDVLCFLNGIPVVLIECKSPKAQEPIPEAIDQLMRYLEQRDYQREGTGVLQSVYRGYLPQPRQVWHGDNRHRKAFLPLDRPSPRHS